MEVYIYHFIKLYTSTSCSAMEYPAGLNYYSWSIINHTVYPRLVLNNFSWSARRCLFIFQKCPIFYSQVSPLVQELYYIDCDFYNFCSINAKFHYSSAIKWSSCYVKLIKDIFRIKRSIRKASLDITTLFSAQIFNKNLYSYYRGSILY